MLKDPDIPFKYNISEGKEARYWLSREGLGTAFDMMKIPINWGLLGKIAFRKNYTKDKVSETIGNFIFALNNMMEHYYYFTDEGTEKKPPKCILSKDMENIVDNLWYNYVSKGSYHSSIVNLSLFNGFLTMEQMDIPITPDNALAWSKTLNSQFKPRRVDDGL